MRVGLVVPGGLDRRSGGYLYDRRLVGHLRAVGDDVRIVDVPTRGYTRRLADGLRPSFVRRLRGVDVLVEDELAHPSLVGVGPLETPRIALVHLLRAADPTDPVRALAAVLESRYLSGVDRVVATSEATRRAVLEVAAVPPERCHVVLPAGDRLSPAVCDTAIHRRAHEGPLRLLALGSLTPRKGLDTLVDALAALEGVELTAVGPHPDPGFRRRLQRTARRRGVSDRFHLLGERPDEALVDELRRAHVLALPSRYEPFGIAALEGMGFGCVPLVSTAGGGPEFVTHGESGLVVPPTSPTAVVRSLRPLRDDRDRLGSMGVAARRAYESHPTWTVSMRQFRSILVDVVTECSR